MFPIFNKNLHSGVIGVIKEENKSPATDREAGRLQP